MVLTGSSFSMINDYAKKAVLYITANSDLNKLTFNYVNKTGVPLKLKGGEPVPGTYNEGGSSFVFNFADIIPEYILKDLVITIEGWHTKFFPNEGDSPAVWSIAPVNDLTLESNKSISFTITNMKVPEGSKSGNFQIGYFAFPDIPDSLSPVLLPISVIPPTI